MAFLAVLLSSLPFGVCPSSVHAADSVEPVSAEPAGAARLVVVRRDGRDIPAPLREQVDQLLLRSVGTQVRDALAYASDVPLEDIELAAGCTAREPDCMQRVSATLGADWLLLRELARDASGNVFLTLIAHDGVGSMVTRRAVGQVGDAQGAGPSDRASLVVPTLVQRLYPSMSASEGPRAPERSPLANIVGWSAAGAGVALVTVGIVMGALSRKSHRAYERTEEVRTRDEVDQAAELLSRSQQRARIANGLLIGGGVAAAAGAATFLWTYLRPQRQDERAVQLDVVPSGAGAQLSLSGAWQGAL